MDAGASMDDLWTYAVTLYVRPGVKEACLNLQDCSGLDVNVILFCCYGAYARCAPFSPSMWDEVIAISRKWQDGVVSHLRDARRSLKRVTHDSRSAPGEKLYNRLTGIELEAERLELAELENLVDKLHMAPEAPDSALSALANLIRYAEAARVTLSARERGDMELIAAAAAGITAG